MTAAAPFPFAARHGACPPIHRHKDPTWHIV